MAGMALDPAPGHRSGLRTASSSARHKSSFLTGFLSAVFQPFSLPVLHPFGGAVHHVARIGVDRRPRGRLQRFERADHGESVPSGCWWSPSRRRTIRVHAPPARRIAAQPPGPGFPEQAPSVKISTRGWSQAVLRGAFDLQVKAQPLGVIARVLGAHQGGGIAVYPVVKPRQKKAQRGAAAQNRQRGDLGGGQFAASADRRRSGFCPW